MPLTAVQSLFEQVATLTCDDQFTLAKQIAANIGYRLVPEAPMPDEPTLEDRVADLERAVWPLGK